MNKLDKFLLKFYKVFGDVKLIDFFVLSFYKYIIYPLVKYYLQISFPELLSVKYRNSIDSLRNFNAFLSDLDITLILKDDSDPIPVVQSYLKLKKIFIMLDSPEIYFKKEYDLLNTFKKENCLPLIDLFWNIRKINWNLDSLHNNPDEFNIIKKKRSITNSLKKITGIDQEIHQDLIYAIEDFTAVDEFIPADTSAKNLCYWSFFLETNKGNHLKIEMTSDQFYFLNSLMPGEPISEKIKDDVSSKFKKNKAVLEFHELYISKSSIRLLQAKGQSTSHVLKWSDYLEKKLGLIT